MFVAAEDGVNPAVLAAFRLDLVSGRQKSFSPQQLSGTRGFSLLLSALRSMSKCPAGLPRVPSGTRRTKHQRDEGLDRGLHRVTTWSWDGGGTLAAHTVSH